MANYKIAYGKKSNMSLAIERGIIPPGCIIMTEDSNEIFFYDLTRNLRTYEERYKFSSIEEAESWINEYDCKGQIFSIHEGDKCNLYVVEYTNELSKITNRDYVIFDKDPTKEDHEYEILTYWINAVTEEVFILVSIKDETANWKSVTGESIPKDLSYRHLQSVAADTWNIQHNLGKYPSVSIVDSAENVVMGEVTYIDTNSLTIKFNGAFSGKAYLN